MLNMRQLRGIAGAALLAIACGQAAVFLNAADFSSLPSEDCYGTWRVSLIEIAG